MKDPDDEGPGPDIITDGGWIRNLGRDGFQRIWECGAVSAGVACAAAGLAPGGKRYGLVSEFICSQRVDMNGWWRAWLMGLAVNVDKGDEEEGPSRTRVLRRAQSWARIAAPASIRPLRYETISTHTHTHALMHARAHTRTPQPTHPLTIS